MKLQEGFIINHIKHGGLAELITIQLCSILSIPRECSTKSGQQCIILSQFREDVFSDVLLVEYIGIFSFITIV